jgi:hypothetical protein
MSFLPILFSAVLMSQPAPDLNQVLKDSFESAKASFEAEKLNTSDVSMTIHLIDSEGNIADRGEFEGDAPMFPASVVKMFWLDFMAHELEARRISLTEENQRSARDMIVDSSNDGTGAVVNLVTGALPGPELDGNEFDAWLEKRNAANRYFASKGYKNLNVLNRTYNEGPYGREQQAIKKQGRNALTTNASARLLTEIMTGKAATQSSCKWMQSLLKRPIPADGPINDSQSSEFIGGVLPAKTKLWSKAGWTSQVRHDVAYFETPDGKKVTLCIFTKKPNNQKLFQFLAREVLDRVR